MKKILQIPRDYNLSLPRGGLQERKGNPKECEVAFHVARDPLKNLTVNASNTQTKKQHDLYPKNAQYNAGIALKNCEDNTKLK